MTDLYMRISFGDDTTAQMADVMEELQKSDKPTFDALNVDWGRPQSPGIAGEPISAAIVLGGAPW